MVHFLKMFELCSLCVVRQKIGRGHAPILLYPSQKVFARAIIVLGSQGTKVGLGVGPRSIIKIIQPLVILAKDVSVDVFTAQLHHVTREPIRISERN